MSTDKDIPSRNNTPEIQKINGKMIDVSPYNMSIENEKVLYHVDVNEVERIKFSELGKTCISCGHFRKWNEYKATYSGFLNTDMICNHCHDLSDEVESSIEEYNGIPPVVKKFSDVKNIKDDI